MSLINTTVKFRQSLSRNTHVGIILDKYMGIENGRQHDFYIIKSDDSEILYHVPCYAIIDLNTSNGEF